MGCRGFLEAIEEGAIYDFLVVRDTFQSRTDYTVHTTNAHPKLVEPLALIADPAFLELEAAQRFLVSARARALLAESK